MQTDAEFLIRKAFTVEIVEKLTQCIRQAYETNILRYDPEIGDDMMLFGLMNYKSKVHNLSKVIAEIPNSKLISKHPQFLMDVKGYRISTYCAGHSSLDEPIDSFPKNNSGAKKITANNLVQMRIPLKTADGEDLFGEARCRNLVLADIGNPTDGLIRLFLGIPTAVDERERISGWSNIVELFSAEEGFLSSPIDFSPSVGLLRGPAVEQILPPTVALKQNLLKEQNDA